MYILCIESITEHKHNNTQEREKKLEGDMQRAVQFKKDRDAAAVQEQVRALLATDMRIHVYLCLYTSSMFLRVIDECMHILSSDSRAILSQFSMKTAYSLLTGRNSTGVLG
jgi:hypothetical protein